MIPEGGSSALGSWGYVRAMHELADDLRGVATPNHPMTVVLACGSGGTAAGLITGAKLLELGKRGIRIAAINVCDDRAYFVNAISRICAEMEERWQLGVHVTAADIDIIDGHVGRGYAKSRPEELATMRERIRNLYPRPLAGSAVDQCDRGRVMNAELALESGLRVLDGSDQHHPRIHADLDALDHVGVEMVAVAQLDAAVDDRMLDDARRRCTGRPLPPGCGDPRPMDGDARRGLASARAAAARSAHRRRAGPYLLR